MDYEFKTTFWSDFSIADKFGTSAIKDTYRRAFHAWKDDTVYVTELAIVLNWKCWSWYNKDEEYSRLYAELYYKLDGWCKKHLKGEDLIYYWETTD